MNFFFQFKRKLSKRNLRFKFTSPHGNTQDLLTREYTRRRQGKKRDARQRNVRAFQLYKRFFSPNYFSLTEVGGAGVSSRQVRTFNVQNMNNNLIILIQKIRVFQTRFIFTILFATAPLPSYLRKMIKKRKINFLAIQHEPHS